MRCSRPASPLRFRPCCSSERRSASLLALLVNDSEPSADTSWSFIASHYPRALLELIRANGGFLRRGEWYTAAYFVGGVLLLLLLAARGGAGSSTTDALMTAGAVARAAATSSQLRSSARSGSSSSSCRWPRTGSRSASRPSGWSATGRCDRLACSPARARPQALSPGTRLDRKARRSLDFGALSGHGRRGGINERRTGATGRTCHRAEYCGPHPPALGDGFRRGSALRSRRSASLVVALVQLGGSSAAATARRRTRSGSGARRSRGRSSPCTCRSSRPGKSSCSTASTPAPNSERLWDPASGTFTSGPVRPEPLLRRPRPARRRPHADRRRPHRRPTSGSPTRRSSTPTTEHVHPRRRTCPSAAGIRRRPSCRTAACSRSRATTSSRTGPGADPPFSDASVNSLPSIFNPKTNTWTDLHEREADVAALSVHVRALGRPRLRRRPRHDDAHPRPATSTWTTVGTSPIDGTSAVMYRPNKIMKAGHLGRPRLLRRGDVQRRRRHRRDRHERADARPGARRRRWRSRASYHNMTLLPDGTVLASGGMSTSDGTDLSKAVLPAEIWNPDTETWTTVASLQNGREYHSTALLLPDGRVLMAGGGAAPRPRDQPEERRDLLAAVSVQGRAADDHRPRPRAPATASSFDVTTPNAAQIAKVSLIRVAVGDARVRPEPAVPVPELHRRRRQGHGAGAGEREPRSSRRLPALPRRHERRARRVGSFVRFSAAHGDTTPPTAPTNLTATAARAGDADLDGGDRRQRDRELQRPPRRRRPASRRAPANRIAQPTGTSYVDSGLAAGTYYYKVTAEDDAGNVGPASNEASATVTDRARSRASSPPTASTRAAAPRRADQSGNGNTGTLSNATWSTTGQVRQRALLQRHATPASPSPTRTRST